MTVYTLEELSRIVDAFSESLNSKEDLPSNKSQSDVRQIIETYVNGTSGYRIWNDGYCEQWGVVSPTSSSLVTVAFTKTFKDKPQVFVNFQYTVSGTASYAYILAQQITTSNFKVNPYTANSGGTNWEAKGYLASDQY